MGISAALLSTPDGPSDGEMARKDLQNTYYNHPTPPRRLLPSTLSTIAMMNSASLLSHSVPYLQSYRWLALRDIKIFTRTLVHSKETSLGAHSDQEKLAYMHISDVKIVEMIMGRVSYILLLLPPESQARSLLTQSWAVYLSQHWSDAIQGSQIQRAGIQLECFTVLQLIDGIMFFSVVRP